MATEKRYYWIKLKDTFFADDGPADFMMSQPNGANYVVLYQMLCLKTINTDGRLSNQIGEVIIPYDIEKIRRTCKYFSTDTVRIALNLYKALGLIYEDVNGTLVISEHSTLVGSETGAAARMRNSRAARNNALPQAVTGGEQNANIVTPEIRDKEIKRSDIRDTEKRDKNKKKADAFSEFAGEDADLLKALQDFEKMRKDIKKPLSDRAKTTLLNKLQTFPTYEWVPILEQSIFHCWQGIFPLDEKPKTAQQPKHDAMDDLRELHELFSEEEQT